MPDTTTYLDLEVIPVDRDEIAAMSYEYIAAHFLGWEPADGDLEAFLIDGNALMVSVLAQLLQRVGVAIFKYMGGLVGLTPLDARPATAGSTWTALDGNGHTIPAGTAVTATDTATGGQVPFDVAADVTIPPGSTVTQPGEVQLTASTPGASGSGLTGQLAPVRVLDFFSSATIVGQTVGGQDPETDLQFVDRLRPLLELMAPRPILAPDFARMMALLVPGVLDAVAIDNYKPGPPWDPAAEDTNASRAVTVVGRDSAGLALSSALRTQAYTLLAAYMPQDFRLYVIDATYTPVDVTFHAVTYSGWDPVAVHDQAVATVQAFLSPVNWGLPSFGDQRMWLNTATVRHGELYAALDRVDGLDYVDTLTIGISGGTQDTTDTHALTGVVPLPTVGAVAGTVVGP